MKHVVGILALMALAGGIAHAQIRPQAVSMPGQCAPCATCAPQIPILESGRPPLPGEEGSGVQSCKLINSRSAWDSYCTGNAIPDCPVLDDAFFVQQTVVALAIDTLTSRPCDGSLDPLWKLDCVAGGGRATRVRVVMQQPGGLCLCSAMPQQAQRLFLAAAVPKSPNTVCRACEEHHTIGCLYE